jgi:hypothetical protein
MERRPWPTGDEDGVHREPNHRTRLAFFTASRRPTFIVTGTTLVAQPADCHPPLGSSARGRRVMRTAFTASRRPTFMVTGTTLVAQPTDCNPPLGASALADA